MCELGPRCFRSGWFCRLVGALSTCKASCGELFMNFQTLQGYKWWNLCCNLTLITLLQNTCLPTVLQVLQNHFMWFQNYRLTSSCPKCSISALSCAVRLRSRLFLCFHHRQEPQIWGKSYLTCFSKLLTHDRAKHPLKIKYLRTAYKVFINTFLFSECISWALKDTKRSGWKNSVHCFRWKRFRTCSETSVAWLWCPCSILVIQTTLKKWFISNTVCFYVLFYIVVYFY